jgi:toxin ParE1/3/4
MSVRAVWRRVAERDVVEAAVYIAADNPAAATRFLDAVDRTIRALRERSGAGRPRSFDNPALFGLRSRLVKGFANYVVFYRQVDGGIEVLRVLHGARDIDALLQDES